MPVGLVGGATKVHPAARSAVSLLGAGTAQQLAEVITAVGLAQNLAALRALATEGIQRGHMALHARNVAVAAGATTDELPHVVSRLVADRAVRADHADQVLAELRCGQGTVSSGGTLTVHRRHGSDLRFVTNARSQGKRLRRPVSGRRTAVTSSPAPISCCGAMRSHRENWADRCCWRFRWRWVRFSWRSRSCPVRGTSRSSTVTHSWSDWRHAW